MARCHHVVCSHISDRPLRNIKLDRYLVLTGTFLVFHFSDNVRDVYARKTADEIPVEGHCRRFLQGCQYERLEGNLFLDLLADNGNKEKKKYFGFIHALHLPPAVFRNSFLLQIN